MIDALKLIRQSVAEAKQLPNTTIMYNFKELPKHKDIKKDKFFGVPAIYDGKRLINTLNVTRKFQ